CSAEIIRSRSRRWPPWPASIALAPSAWCTSMPTPTRPRTCGARCARTAPRCAGSSRRDGSGDRTSCRSASGATGRAGRRSGGWGEQGMRWHRMVEIEERGADEVVALAIDEALEGADAIYLSVDIDVLDPSAAPGTGTPE